jgi:hypothetical protein
LPLQIGELLKPSPYKAPKCHLVLNVAGLTAGGTAGSMHKLYWVAEPWPKVLLLLHLAHADEVLQALSGRDYLAVEPELEEQTNIADAVNEWLDGLAGSNPDVPLIMLDQAAVQVGLLSKAIKWDSALQDTKHTFLLCIGL